MNPLNLPGGQFLAFWLTGGAAIAIAIIVVRSLVARDRGPASPEVLHPLELAYLQGGIERAVEAAVVGLHHRGALVIEGDRLRPGAPLTGATEVELHVLDNVRRGSTTVAALVEGAAHVDENLRARLVYEGYLVANPAAQLWVYAGAIAWLVLAGAKICVGISRHRPVGFLTLLVIVGACIVPQLKLPRRTRRGDRALAAESAAATSLGGTALTAPQLLTADEIMLAYALLGAAWVGGAVIATLPSHARMLAAAASSSTTSSGGGGCGGGGCGGGCGGCS